jgi:hypothetical protein
MNARLLGIGTMLLFLVAGATTLQPRGVRGGAPDGETPWGENRSSESTPPPGADYVENPDCGGFNFPGCGTEADVPPVLASVTIKVDGEPSAMPLTIWTTSKLRFLLKFSYPNGVLSGGHVFVVKDGDPICIDWDGSAAPPDSVQVPAMFVDEEYETPIDPSLFLNGDGSPFFVEISNGCGTHSNRLPLDIVTREAAGHNGGGCGG